MKMPHASCLCRAIRYDISGELRSPRWCHCENCRRWAGAAPAAWTVVRVEQLSIDPSGAPVIRYDSGRGRRCACARCGSPVWFESKDFPDWVALPMGALEGDSLPAPAMRIWVKSNPSWCNILDDLPRHETDPPA